MCVCVKKGKTMTYENNVQGCQNTTQRTLHDLRLAGKDSTRSSGPGLPSAHHPLIQCLGWR